MVRGPGPENFIVEDNTQDRNPGGGGGGIRMEQQIAGALGCPRACRNLRGAQKQLQHAALDMESLSLQS